MTHTSLLIAEKHTQYKSNRNPPKVLVGIHCLFL